MIFPKGIRIVAVVSPHLIRLAGFKFPLSLPLRIGKGSAVFFVCMIASMKLQSSCTCESDQGPGSCSCLGFFCL